MNEPFLRSGSLFNFLTFPLVLIRTSPSPKYVFSGNLVLVKKNQIQAGHGATRAAGYMVLSEDHVVSY